MTAEKEMQSRLIVGAHYHASSHLFVSIFACLRRTYCPVCLFNYSKRSRFCMERQLDYRARIVAMYEKYCPEKPLSHVEFLLAKYKGFEDELMEVLVEKYGPEPTQRTKAMSYGLEVARALGADQQHTPQSIQSIVSKYEGMEEALLYAANGMSPMRLPRNETGIARDGEREQAMLVRESDADRDAVFRQRQDQFRKDMSSISKERQHAAAQKLQEAIAVAHDTVQSQEKEIRTLRSDLQAIKMRHEETNAQLEEDIRRVASELTTTKLELMRLEGMATPGQVPLSQLNDVEAKMTTAAGELLQALQTLYVYERVVRTHLAMHPVTPLRTRLRELDAALCARLDSL